MKTNFSILFICLLVNFGAFAQHNTSELPTSISETGAAPDNSAILDLQSSNKGLLAPRMTYAEIKAIPSPAEGLIVYDTDNDCLKIFNGFDWDCLYQKAGDFRGRGQQQSISMLGGSGSQYGYDIAADALGNFYVIGNYTGTTVFGNTTLTNTNGNVFIVKYDSSGTAVWAETITSNNPGLGDDRGYSIAVSQNGDVYVTGYTRDSYWFYPDVFVAKYNTSGTLQWMEIAGGDNYHTGYAIDVDSNGDAYVTGEFSNTLTFHDGTTLISNGTTDIFIAKYSSTGALLWAKGIGGTSGDRAEGLVLDNAGNLYITGGTEGGFFDGINISSAGYFDVFVAKYDINGNVQWVKSAGGSGGNDFGKQITLDDAGNIYVVGDYYQQANFDGNQIQAIGQSDAFMAVYDNQGNLIWVKRVAGGSSGDYAYGATTDTNGNIYVTGSFTGLTVFDDIVLEGSSLGDAFIVKYDSTGNLLWVQRAGNDNTSDAGRGATTAPNGDVYITGYLSGIAVFGETFIVGEGSSDVFVVKYSQ